MQIYFKFNYRLIEAHLLMLLLRFQTDRPNLGISTHRTALGSHIDMIIMTNLVVVDLVEALGGVLVG